MADTKMKMSSNLHVAMFPWFAFGHFIPFLHLSNRLAERGNKISFFIPKGAQSKLTKLNQFPNLIHFFPLIVPHVDGLPLGAETLSDIPISLQNQLCTAMDRTKDQVKTLLSTIKPDFVLYDFAFWVPSLGQELGFKSIRYVIVCAALPALSLTPCEKMVKGMWFEEMMQTQLHDGMAAEFGSGLSLYERLDASSKNSNALAIRTCYEIEGPFIDQLAHHYSKPVLLTGPLLPEKSESPLEEKWAKWLAKFEAGSVVYCAFGSQTSLEKTQFQELLLGFELCGLPFLMALSPPIECSTVEEAMPDGFQERVNDRGMVYGGWVPQPQILEHPCVGCFVSHVGSSSMWESLQSDCQIVVVPLRFDYFVHSMIMVEELGVAVRVRREEDGWISKESLSNTIKSAMSLDSEVAPRMKNNHVKWRKFVSDKHIQETYLDTFIKICMIYCIYSEFS